MLKARILTALVLAAVIVAAIAWSPLAVAALVTLALALAQAEWLQLAGWRPMRALPVSLAAGVALYALLLWAPDLVAQVTLPVLALAAALWLLIAALLLRVERGHIVHIGAGASAALAFLMTLGAWLAAMQFLRIDMLLLLSVLVIVWLADTAAYFAGRAFGRRKLAPRISPGKTWAGVVGAMLAVVLVAVVVWRFWPSPAVYSNRLLDARGAWIALPLLALLVAFSIVGDLWESLLKRQAGAKDSGHLLPGHGGFFDRLDAMLALLPAAALIRVWLR